MRAKFVAGKEMRDRRKLLDQAAVLFSGGNREEAFDAPAR